MSGSTEGLSGQPCAYDPPVKATAMRAFRISIGVMAWRTFRSVWTIPMDGDVIQKTASEETDRDTSHEEPESRDEREEIYEPDEAFDDEEREVGRPQPVRMPPDGGTSESLEEPEPELLADTEASETDTASDVGRDAPKDVPFVGEISDEDDDGESFVERIPPEGQVPPEDNANVSSGTDGAEEPTGARWGALREKLDMVRALWTEWSPVGRGVLKRLRGVVKLKRFRIRGTLGAGDPALTGLALSAIHGLRGLEGSALKLDVDGDFTSARAAGAIEAEWKISLVRIWSAATYVGWTLFRRWWIARREKRHIERRENRQIAGRSTRQED